MGLNISIVDASNVRNKVMEKFGVKLHIHDTCGAFYMNIDEPNKEIAEYVVKAFADLGQEVRTEDDGMYFTFTM